MKNDGFISLARWVLDRQSEAIRLDEPAMSPGSKQVKENGQVTGGKDVGSDTTEKSHRRLSNDAWKASASFQHKALADAHDTAADMHMQAADAAKMAGETARGEAHEEQAKVHKDASAKLGKAFGQSSMWQHNDEPTDVANDE